MEDYRAPLWTLLGIFIVFKVATTAMILIMDPNGITETLALFFAFHWPFILGGFAFAIAFAAVSAACWVRLVRVRARRRELQAAEWRAD